ncbi:alkylated DNA repair protein alkB homolog 8 [Anopheles bellator]|uniref:alkylated DNA repair protein alkB homolog 8 n=1 Tax=Anopheles bellator TaxID=139047 RepID=UPI00264829F7|nr:alkylated DNA repair protein alkB homolog 8 [Anopheles bellator]
MATTKCLSKSAGKKIDKKIKRCQLLIEKDAGVQFSAEPTENIVVCNAGLSTGLQQEALLQEVLLHGHVQRVQLPPGKSYCFLKLQSKQVAEAVHSAMNGICPLGQDGAVLLLSFCCDMPPSFDRAWCAAAPEGLIVARDFVDPALERVLLAAVSSCDDHEPTEQHGSVLKNRKVKHFGYEFLYGSNNVDRSKPLRRNIPSVCGGLWERLRELYPSLNWHVPDQLTVNWYEPGQGIPAHVDTHSAFEDPILSLSLGSDIVMEFRHPVSGRQTLVDLPARSLLILSGESRYAWTHGITSRKLDTVPASHGGGLTVRKRQLRVSLTFRKLRLSDRCDCSFPACCDTAKRGAFDRPPSASIPEALAARVEAENVHRVYDQIAKHFSDTRHSPWPRVEAFIRTLDTGAIVLDVGCGNGKYLGSNPSALMLGCDRSDGLLQVCRERGFNVLQCDCLAVPFRDSSVDACISIAVIHHLATDSRRRKAIAEMVRVLCPGGRALIYVWAKNQEANAKKSSYLRQNRHNNKPPPSDARGPADPIAVVPMETVAGLQECSLPVHTNRTPFQHRDLLVPWKLRPNISNTSMGKDTFLRFYHVFEEHELEKVCLDSAAGGIEIVESYYDQGNWCVIIEKTATCT